MIFLRLLLLIILGIAQNSYAHSFNEAIKQDHFYVKPSQKTLSKLHEASTLVIGCVDFRLRDEIERFLEEELSLLDKYDEIILPGASLAFVQTKYPSWSKTIEETTKILIKLHNIKRVIFIDHMGCGAYKLLKGEAIMASKETELLAHKETLHAARAKMKAKFPELEIYTFVMDLEGHIEHIK